MLQDTGWGQIVGNVRLLVLLLLCSAVANGYWIWKDTRPAPASKADLAEERERRAVNAPRVVDAFTLYRTPATYPDTPTQVNMNFGNTVFPMKEAATQKQIIRWAVVNRLSYDPDQLGRRSAFVCDDSICSGPVCPLLYIWSYHEIGTNDPKPWKLVFVGFNGAQKRMPRQSDQYSVDYNTGFIRCADETGIIVNSIDIRPTLAAIDKGWAQLQNESKRNP